MIFDTITSMLHTYRVNIFPRKNTNLLSAFSAAFEKQSFSPGLGKIFSALAFGSSSKPFSSGFTPRGSICDRDWELGTYDQKMTFELEIGSYTDFREESIGASARLMCWDSKYREKRNMAPKKQTIVYGPVAGMRVDTLHRIPTVSSPLVCGKMSSKRMSRSEIATRLSRKQYRNNFIDPTELFSIRSQKSTDDISAYRKNFVKGPLADAPQLPFLHVPFDTMRDQGRGIPKRTVFVLASDTIHSGSYCRACKAEIDVSRKELLAEYFTCRTVYHEAADNSAAKLKGRCTTTKRITKSALKSPERTTILDRREEIEARVMKRIMENAKLRSEWESINSLALRSSPDFKIVQVPPLRRDVTLGQDGARSVDFTLIYGNGYTAEEVLDTGCEEEM
ncbi:hypothetical protein ACFE04_000034 [Oxalis oulophora]